MLLACPEALAVVFTVLRGCEEQARMQALLHLAFLLKCEPGNVAVWLHQPGWQLWLLDLLELEDESSVRALCVACPRVRFLYVCVKLRLCVLYVCACVCVCGWVCV
jgi:hypothetical protein